MRSFWSLSLHLLGMVVPCAALHADTIPVLPCSACFPANYAPLVGATTTVVLTGTGANQSGSPLSTIPISGSSQIAGSTGVATLSYASDFATGMHFTVNAQSSGSQEATAQFSGVLFDSFYVVGALPGSVLSVSSITDFISSSDPTSYNPQSTNSITPGMLLISPSQGTLGLGYSCDVTTYVNVQGAFSDTCTVRSYIPSDGLLVVENEIFGGVTAQNASVAYILAKDTDRITNVQVFDTSGKPETGVQLYSASGVNYNAGPSQNPSVTPEAPSLLLLATGILGIGAAKFSDQRNRQTKESAQF